MRQGLSLIELLVVVAIVGVLAGLGFTGQGLLDRGRLAEAVSLVDREIGDARRTAKRTDQTVEVSFAVSDGRWAVVVDGRARSLPPAIRVDDGESIELALEPPFGTFGDGTARIRLLSRFSQADVWVVGVLARTVVVR